MPYLIRPARVDDAGELLAIYAPFVTDTTVSFETEVPSVEEFRARIERGLSSFAYLVAVDEQTGSIAGYAYYGPFRSRPAYAWSVEISIYLAAEHRGNGLGARSVHAGSRRPHEHRVHHLEQQRVHRVSREAWVPRLRHPCRLWLQARQLARHHMDGKTHHAGRCGAAAPHPTLPKLRIGRERHHLPYERSEPERKPRPDSDLSPAATRGPRV